jgi:ABC-2 type transport system permease protein
VFSVFRSLIRTTTFVRKEIIEVLRQPRLLIMLVIGPFLILLLFGIGYRSEGRVLRTLFVSPASDPMTEQIKKNPHLLGRHIELAGITQDEVAAKKSLRKGRVDLVVVAPPNAAEEVRENRPAIFTLYHNEVDPYQSEYIKFTGELYVSKLNDQVLGTFAEKGKADVYHLRRELKDAIGLTRQIRLALEQNLPAQAKQRRIDLGNKLTNLENFISARAAALQGTGNGTIQTTRQKIRSTMDSVSQIDDKSRNYDQEIVRLSAAEQDLTNLDKSFDQFTTIDPKILLTPFRTQTEQIATVKLELSQYFAPSVIILLLQHLAVTFAALSMVKEFRIGTVELFRVAPLKPMETLAGKYIGYMILGGFVATVLSGLLIYALKVPMLGSWHHYSWIVAALLFASLGLGFVISLISKTDSQAIQYAMILLLTTIFFSGFLLNLKLLWEPVRAISWTLPATYGILLLQNVMLRGFLTTEILSILVAIGIVLAIFSLLLLRRRLTQI